MRRPRAGRPAVAERREGTATTGRRRGRPAGPHLLRGSTATACRPRHGPAAADRRARRSLASSSGRQPRAGTQSAWPTARSPSRSALRAMKSRSPASRFTSTEQAGAHRLQRRPARHQARAATRLRQRSDGDGNDQGVERIARRAARPTSAARRRRRRADVHRLASCHRQPTKSMYSGVLTSADDPGEVRRPGPDARIGSTATLVLSSERARPASLTLHSSAASCSSFCCASQTAVVSVPAAATARVDHVSRPATPVVTVTRIAVATSASRSVNPSSSPIETPRYRGRLTCAHASRSCKALSGWRAREISNENGDSVKGATRDVAEASTLQRAGVGRFCRPAFARIAPARASARQARGRRATADPRDRRTCRPPTCRRADYGAAGSASGSVTARCAPLSPCATGPTRPL